MVNDGLTRRQRRETQQMRSDMRAVLASPEGRRVLLWVLQCTNIYAGSYTGDNDTFYREGRRAVGLRIIAELNAVDPMAYVGLLNDSVSHTQQALSEAREDGEDDDA